MKKIKYVKTPQKPSNLYPVCVPLNHLVYFIEPLLLAKILRCKHSSCALIYENVWNYCLNVKNICHYLTNHIFVSRTMLTLEIHFSFYLSFAWTQNMNGPRKGIQPVRLKFGSFHWRERGKQKPKHILPEMRKHLKWVANSEVFSEILELLPLTTLQGVAFRAKEKYFNRFIK